MNTATRERLIENTVKAICLAPTKAAFMRLMPCSRQLSIFSIMTMASSTTKPTEMVSAMRERLSMENPAAHIAAQVPTRERGTVIPAAMTGVSRRRKAKTTIMTKRTDIKSVD